MSFCRNDPPKSTAGVFKNGPEVVFGGRFRVRPETTPETPGPPFPKTGPGSFWGSFSQNGLRRSGGRFAERPSEWVRGRFRKRRPVVFGVVKGVIGIGWIEEAAARFHF